MASGEGQIREGDVYCLEIKEQEEYKYLYLNLVILLEFENLVLRNNGYVQNTCGKGN